VDVRRISRGLDAWTEYIYVPEYDIDKGTTGGHGL